MESGGCADVVLYCVEFAHGRSRLQAEVVEIVHGRLRAKKKVTIPVNSIGTVIGFHDRMVIVRVKITVTDKPKDVDMPFKAELLEVQKDRKCNTDLLLQSCCSRSVFCVWSSVQ